jgi:ParB-like chromosome segregation protein Spo0J
MRSQPNSARLGGPSWRTSAHGSFETVLVRRPVWEATVLAAPANGGPQICAAWPELSGVCSVPLARLLVGYSPREVKVDAGHVAALMEVVDHLPPVIVDDRTMTVIDGVHRVEAFRRAGRSHINALMFNGEGPEAMALAIEANVKHGKPLSRGERRAAASNLLYAFPERSDRWVAEVCGLSHTTVALVRRGLSLTEGRVRTGRDGRRRPVDKLAGQVAVARAITENPATSVRQMAGAAGVAPSTVQRARARLRGKGFPPVSASQAVPGLSSAKEDKRADFDLPPAAHTTEPGDWLVRTAVSVEDVGNYLGNLPLSRIYEVADECRRRARVWAEMADALEGRCRSRLCGNRRP